MAGAIVGALAAAALLGVGLLLYGWNGPATEYFLSEGLNRLVGIGSAVAAAGVLLLLARYSIFAFAPSVLVLALPFLWAMVSEMVTEPSSHNLFPIEAFSYLVGSVLLHLPALAVSGVWWGLRARSRRHAEPDRPWEEAPPLP